MTYKPKRAGKMEDVNTPISLDSSQMSAYFCKDLVTVCCLYLVKI